jgi:hypothetical protein
LKNDTFEANDAVGGGGQTGGLGAGGDLYVASGSAQVMDSIFLNSQARGGFGGFDGPITNDIGDGGKEAAPARLP